MRLDRLYEEGEGVEGGGEGKGGEVGRRGGRGRRRPWRKGDTGAKMEWMQAGCLT